MLIILKIRYLKTFLYLCSYAKGTILAFFKHAAYFFDQVLCGFLPLHAVHPAAVRAFLWNLFRFRVKAVIALHADKCCHFLFHLFDFACKFKQS